MTTNPGESCWTERDLEILEALALKIRVLTAAQVGSAWWQDSKPKQQLSNARNRLRRMERAGLVHRYVMNSHPLLELSRPVSTWTPGEPMPEFRAVSNSLQNRWQTASDPHTVYAATRKTSNLFGGYPIRLKSLQVTHDLHLGQVFLLYQIRSRETASRWIGEDALKRAGYGIKEPDAFLLDPAGKTERVIEFGGKYSADRVSDFHDYCDEREFSYELW